MNQLEGQVRPFLAPLVLGERVSLSIQQVATLATWIAMKGIVAEHGAPGEALTPEPDRIALKERGVIPEYFHIYLAAHSGPHAVGLVRHSLCLAIGAQPIRPPLHGTAKNIEAITFIMGRVFVHLIAARIEDFHLESRVSTQGLHDQCRLWPPQLIDPIWPRAPVFTADDVNTIGESLDVFFKASNASWGGDI